MSDSLHKSPFNSLPFWLLIAASSFTFSFGRALAADEAPPAESVKAASSKLPERITTQDGKTYDKVTLEKVVPDGLLVSFAPAEGGSGTAKLKFRNLPPELRERFGYDPTRASDYETAQARGEANWLAQSAAWTEQRQAALAAQATSEREMRAQTEARLAAEAQQARIDAAYNAQQSAPYYYYPGYFWPDTFNSFQHHRGQGFRHNQNQPVGVAPSPVSPFMSPMRPRGK
jgi:hypothetical protein